MNCNISNKQKVEIIKNFCDDYVGDYRFYPDYSGRSMYGRNCVGIVCDYYLETLVLLCDYIYSSLKEDLEDDSEDLAQKVLGSIRLDNLGREYIMYFPSITDEE